MDLKTAESVVADQRRLDEAKETLFEEERRKQKDARNAMRAQLKQQSEARSQWRPVVEALERVVAELEGVGSAPLYVLNATALPYKAQCALDEARRRQARSAGHE